MFVLAFVFIIISLIISTEANEDFNVIETSDGPLRGRRLYTFLDGKPYHAYKGIPYAEPPINQLRFKSPRKIETCHELKDTFEFGSRCVQINYFIRETEGNEDCLFLNVFVPAKISTYEKFPVMIFIHGGGYFIGTSSMYGPDFLIENDVITVTLNYRLGPYGFLSLGTVEYSGNMGLKDQLMAIKWVNDNIEYFGGNKSSITLFGQSAGSVSTHLHSISPVSNGLFQRIILQSGTFFNPWAYYTGKNHLHKLNEIYNETDKKLDNEGEIVRYLLSVDAYQFVKETFIEIYKPGEARKELKFIWSPVVEVTNANSPFLTQDPDFLSENMIDTIDTLIGYTASGETYGDIGKELVNPELLIPFDNQFEIPLPLIGLNYDYKSQEYKKIAEQIRYFYFGKDVRVNNATLIQYSNLMGDSWTVYGVNKAAKRLSIRSTGKTFYYRFSLDTKLNAFKILSGAKKMNFPGASHSDDLFYLFKIDDPLFGNIYDNQEKHSNEVKNIRLMTKLWTNFAKYGNPTPDSNPVHFKPIENNEMHFLDITNDALMPDVDPYGSRMMFWDDLLNHNFLFNNTNN